MLLFCVRFNLCAKCRLCFYMCVIMCNCIKLCFHCILMEIIARNSDKRLKISDRWEHLQRVFCLQASFFFFFCSQLKKCNDYFGWFWNVHLISKYHNEMNNLFVRANQYTNSKRSSFFIESLRCYNISRVKCVKCVVWLIKQKCVQWNRTKRVWNCNKMQRDLTSDKRFICDTFVKFVLFDIW